jgi:glutaredoxin
MSVVTIYTKPDCHLCVQALQTLRGLRAELPFALVVLDITQDDALHRAYFERIPVVSLDGEELFDYFVDAEILSARLRDAAAARAG